MFQGDIRNSFSIGRSLQSGFDALKRAPVVMLIGGVLYILVSGGGGGSFQAPTSDSGTGLVVAGLLTCFALVLALITWAASAFIRPGFYRAVRAVLAETEDYNSLGTLFGGSDRFKDMLIWRFIHGAAGFASAVPLLACMAIIIFFTIEQVGSDFISVIDTGGDLPPETLETLMTALVMGSCSGLILLIPIIYVNLGLMLGDYYVTFDSCEPIEAMQKSWKAVRGHRIHLFIYSFVMNLISSLGIFLCCIGVLATVPIVQAGFVESFMLFHRGTVEDDPGALH